MKIATTPAPDFTALKSLTFIHTADWAAIELQHKQAAYARLYQRYTHLLLMEEEGMEVTITMRSDSASLTITDDDFFQPMEYLGQVGQRLTRLAGEILALLEKQQTNGLHNDSPGEAAENELRRQALALCLPEASAPAEAPAAPATSAARAA